MADVIEGNIYINVVVLLIEIIMLLLNIDGCIQTLYIFWIYRDRTVKFYKKTLRKQQQ